MHRIGCAQTTQRKSTVHRCNHTRLKTGHGCNSTRLQLDTVATRYGCNSTPFLHAKKPHLNKYWWHLNNYWWHSKNYSVLQYILRCAPVNFTVWAVIFATETVKCTSRLSLKSALTAKTFLWVSEWLKIYIATREFRKTLLDAYSAPIQSKIAVASRWPVKKQCIKMLFFNKTLSLILLRFSS